MTEAERWRVLVERFLAGEATSGEEQALRAWLGADPARAAYGERLEAGRQQVAAGLPEVSVTRAIDRIRSRAGLAPAGMPTAGGPNAAPMHARGYRVALLRAAAVVVGAVGVGTAVMLWRDRAPHGLAGRVYATPAGRRETVTLTDGTEFTLAPASTLRVPVDYGAGDRAVALDGEAFFTVTHDARHPFTVRAGSAVATDVGTAFDVRAYAGDGAVRIAVAEGAVVAGPSRGTVHERPLRSGDVATVSDTTITVASGVDVAAFSGWTGGRLAFTDAPIPEVAAELARWYGVHVTVQGAGLRARDVTLTLERLPLATALGVVARAAGARVEQERGGATYALSDALAGAAPDIHSR